MALADHRVACRRLTELFKDDIGSAARYMATLGSIDADAFLVLRNAWEAVMDTPMEKRFLEIRLSVSPRSMYEINLNSVWSGMSTLQSSLMNAQQVGHVI
ncbi:hypothetical protein Vafri_8987 [Volvox africanus]|uniref:Uncharacterized protein n=1 Tax=Volvox africanus TaxID=51714 RepID=A0A8J4EZB1_9CHLO|nr:hypothetical protein Vafri_8987 [Volvox africanus]